MLMFNHNEKEDKDSLPRTRAQSIVADKSPPLPNTLLDFSSNPGTPIKLVDVKTSSTGW